MAQEKIIKIDYSDTVEISTRYTKRMETENSSTLKTASVISCFIGGAGLILYIILEILLEKSLLFTASLLPICSLLFASGLVFWLAVNKAIRECDKIDTVNNFVFTKDAVLISSYSDGEYVSEAKCYYKKFAKIKETRHYLFLCTNRGNFDIDKCLLSADELDKIKHWCNSSRNQVQAKEKE